MPANTGSPYVRLSPDALRQVNEMGKAFARAIEDIKRVAALAGEQLSDFVRAFTHVYDTMRGVPHQPLRELSPFEQALFDLDRDRCIRASAIQDRLLDVRY